MCHTRAQSLSSRLHRLFGQVSRVAWDQFRLGQHHHPSLSYPHTAVSTGSSDKRHFLSSACRTADDPLACVSDYFDLNCTLHTVHSIRSNFSFAFQCIYVYNVISFASLHLKSTFETEQQNRSLQAASPLLFPPTVFAASRLAPVQLTDRRRCRSTCPRGRDVVHFHESRCSRSCARVAAPTD